MKIGIYVEVLKNKQFSGIGKHVQGLINGLAEIDRENEYYLYYQSPVIGQIEAPIEISERNFNLRPVKFPTTWMSDRPTLWWKYVLPMVLKIDGIDVFHGPNHFIPLRGKFKKVVTIHDIAYFYMAVHGEGLDRVLKDWTLKSFAAADEIITVSDATKRDCIKEGCDAEHIHTVYQGFENDQKVIVAPEKSRQIKEKLNLPKRYLLSLGTLQPRKNIPYLVEAFSKIADLVPHDLVLAGAKGESYESISQQVRDLGLKDRVVFTGYISDEERVVLYRNADVFIYPSKYEGFGLVVLESMSHNCPVIAMNSSSLPEAVGDAGLLVELDDVDAFASCIKQIVDSENVKSCLVAKGNEWIKEFNWEKAAKQTIKVYEQA